MKTLEEIKSKYRKDTEEINQRYKEEFAKLYYQYVIDLMNLISDSELYDLYQEYSELFAKASKINSWRDAIDMEYYVRSIISVLEEFISNRGLTKDEFEAMTKDEFISYLTKILWDKDLSFSDIKYLELYDPRNQED